MFGEMTDGLILQLDETGETVRVYEHPNDQVSIHDQHGGYVVVSKRAARQLMVVAIPSVLLSTPELLREVTA